MVAQDGRQSSASTVIQDVGYSIRQVSRNVVDRLTPSVFTRQNTHKGANTMQGMTSFFAPRAPPGVPHHHLRFAFLGDLKAGKTSLLE